MRGAQGVAFVVEGMNVTLNKEAVDASCTPHGGTTGGVAEGPGMGPPKGGAFDTCVPEQLGPITMPSVGVEGAF